MKETTKNIYPGQGLGEVKFGMTPKQVEAILGKPYEIATAEFEIPNEEEEEFSVIWHYDEEELSLEFEKEESGDRFKLVIISVTGEEYMYNDMPLIGKPWIHLEPLLYDLHLTRDQTEDENVFVQFSDLLNISLWFEDGMLTEIQWTQVLSDVDMN